jgi:hypothetical protein
VLPEWILNKWEILDFDWLGNILILDGCRRYKKDVCRREGYHRGSTLLPARTVGF